MFSRNLYISSAIKRPRVVKWKLKHGAGQLMVYVVTASTTADGQLDILHAVNLKQEYYKRHPVFVYGLAQTRRGAMKILTRIAGDSLAAGYGADFRGYLEDRENKNHKNLK